MKAKVVKIDELLTKLPRDERERIVMEERRQERLALKEIEENLWKKWRGNVEKKEKNTRDTKGVDLDKRIEKIQIHQLSTVEY